MQSPQALHGALSLQRLIFLPPSRKYGLFYHKQIHLLMASSVLISVDKPDYPNNFLISLSPYNFEGNTVQRSQNSSSHILSSRSCLWVQCRTNPSSPSRPVLTAWGLLLKYAQSIENQTSLPLSSTRVCRAVSRFLLISSVSALRYPTQSELPNVRM